MNCSKCISLLDEFVEGELGDGDAFQLMAHLAACPHCQNACEELRREQYLYAHCLLSVEATPALWNGIESAIEQERQKEVSPPRFFRNRIGAISALLVFKPQPSAVVTAVLLAVLVSIIFLNKYEFKSGNSSPEIASSNTADVRFQPEESEKRIDEETKPKLNDLGDKFEIHENAIRLKTRAKSESKNKMRRAEPSERKNQLTILKLPAPARQPVSESVVANVELEYLNAITLLSRDIEKQRKPLTAQTVALLEQSDSLISETRRAVRKQPRDPAAVQYMTTAYAKKIELLRMIAAE